MLANEDNKFRLEIKESLLIKQDKPRLNQNIRPSQLYLFIVYNFFNSCDFDVT